MLRRGFITAGTVAAATFAAAPAWATGGLDTFAPSASPTPWPQSIRVLLGSGLATVIDERSFAFGSRQFRGSFSALPDGGIVNTVSLEEYLYSVVPMESPPSWPPEALKAQAIVARTYAASRINPTRAYDVVASQRDQAYGGLRAEYPQSTTACDATSGQVLRWNGAVASVSYMSCCGGHTEDPADAWVGGADVPYLKGVACTYCNASPDYHWMRQFSMTSVSNAMASRLQEIGSVQAIDVARSDASGRAKSIRFTGESGSLEISGADFRRLMGPSVVRSLLIHSITVSAAASTQAAPIVTIEGSGSGHGVGLCQWGSRGLAAQGRQARDILAFYFPGIQIQ